MPKCKPSTLKTLFLVVAATILAASESAAASASDPPIDGARLLFLCTNPLHASPNVAAIGTVYCQGYIDGAHDALNQHRRDNGLGPCPNEGYSSDKAISVVTRYLTAYPTYADINGAAVVALAILSAWKCI